MTTATQNTDREISTVGDIAASRTCLSFPTGQYVKLILKAMQHSRTGTAGIIDEQGYLCGLLTEREILRRIFAMISDNTLNHSKMGKYIDDMIVDDVMIQNPKTLTENTDIEDALEIMTDLGFRYMPVVSSLDDRRLLGIVDEREVAIHVKSRLEQLKEETRRQESLLGYLFHEPYGAAFTA